MEVGRSVLANMREMGYQPPPNSDQFFLHSSSATIFSKAIASALFTFDYTLLIYSTTLTTSTEKWCYASAIPSRLLGFIS